MLSTRKVALPVFLTLAISAVCSALTFCADRSLGNAQQILSEISFEGFDVTSLEDTLGVAEIEPGRELIMGYRGDELAVICTSEELARNPSDRSLKMGKTREEYLYTYPELGLVFRMFDNPWMLYKIELSNPNLLLRNIRPGELVSTVSGRFEGLPIPGRINDGETCSWRWGSTTLYGSCPVGETEPAIKRVAVRNPDLPDGCELSFRGMYE